MMNWSYLCIGSVKQGSLSESGSHVQGNISRKSGKAEALDNYYKSREDIR